MLAVGCSYTRGYGLDDEENNPNLWVNQIAQRIGCTQIKNISESGWNNESIFHACMQEIMHENYDIVIIGWSAIPRYNFHIGLEYYHTRSRLTPDYDIHINNKTFTGKYLDTIRNKLLEFHNDHWDILKLISYVNTIIQIQVNLKNKKVFFVNGLGPWEENYFSRKNFVKPDDLDKYTQELISCQTRDDNEIESIYNKIHDSYEKAGGICEWYWLNLYNSLMHMQIDRVSNADGHPGLKSQDIFVENLLYQLSKKI